VNEPEFCKIEYLEYLDELRKSGVTNMFGARPYLMDEYPELGEEQARDVLLYWMRSFGERSKGEANGKG